MNILHHKKWHVRTKENMIRVRKDMKKAEEEEKAVLDREILATNEARLAALRKHADTRMDTMFGVRRTEGESEQPEPSSSGGHINFFAELEEVEAKNVGDTNKEFEEEKKKEQFEWEKKMGIQMKLGDDGNEGKGYWFDKIPLRRGIKEMRHIEEEQARTAKLEERKKEVKEKRKRRAKSEDDETSDDEEKRRRDKKKRKKEKKRKSGKKEKKEKKRKREKHSSSSESEDEETVTRREEEEKKAKLLQLRDERLKRERMEQAKTQLILHPELARKKEEEAKKNAPKYNSGFNPHLAKR